jgi:hypothetical protein
MAAESKASEKKQEQPNRCFVIMPVSDVEPYPTGHWQRVYQNLIEPACKAAGYAPTLASQVQQTNFIVLDILQRTISSEMVVCDLSSRNPNVMYELGIRQAFNKPVVLIKDTNTDRVFDIQGLRDVEYDPSLRIDLTQASVTQIADALKQTAKAKGDVNSLVSLLGMTAAQLPESNKVTGDTALILKRLDDIASRVARVEKQTHSPQPPPHTPYNASNPFLGFTPSGAVIGTDIGANYGLSGYTSSFFTPGTRVRDRSGREGTVVISTTIGGLSVVGDDGETRQYFSPASDLVRC